MELLQTHFTDCKQNNVQLESELSVSKQNFEPQVVKLQEENKALEAQLISVQVGVVDDGLIQIQLVLIHRYWKNPYYSYYITP